MMISRNFDRTKQTENYGARAPSREESGKVKQHRVEWSRGKDHTLFSGCEKLKNISLLRTKGKLIQLHEFVYFMHMTICCIALDDNATSLS